MTFTGGCLCGAVRYTIDSPPLITRTCWCRVCQYIGAGSATVNALFPRTAVAITGELRVFDNVADSGNLMHRHFCPACGTHVMATAPVRPEVVVVRVGTLDERERTRPELTIWTASAPSWACIDEQLPTLPGQPPPPRST